MRTLYIDCAMGAAGDMLSGALLELYHDKDGFISFMNYILGGRAYMSAVPDVKCGVGGTHVNVYINGEQEHEHHHHHDHDHDHDHHHHHEHSHNGLHEIYELIRSMDIPEKVRFDAENVYRIIAEAESAVHGKPLDQVHFHEVGSIDALADVLSVCVLMHELQPERVLASPVNVGGGTVRCAHGVLPVPAPATELILRDVPVYSGKVKAELCTPTGAALLKYFVHEFVPMPQMRVQQSGYGTGTKDFEVMNAVRVLLGETESESTDVLELSCNIDDMTAEELGFAMETLLQAGALDVWFTSIGMKKCRPGTMLSCLCLKQQREEMLHLIFKHTSTLGVRENECRRSVLSRSAFEKDTTLGFVRGKYSHGFGVEKAKIEYEDLAAKARECGMSLRDVKKIVE